MVHNWHTRSAFPSQTEADPAELESSKQLLQESKERLAGLGVSD